MCANYTDDTAQLSKYEFRTCEHVCVCVCYVAVCAHETKLNNTLTL